MKRLFAPLLLAALVGASLATIAAVLLGAGSGGGSTSTVGAARAATPASSSSGGTRREVSAPSGSSKALTATQIYKQDSTGVVAIKAVTSEGEDEGTGIVLNEKGLILTNDHVIKGATSLSVDASGSSKKTTSATIVGEEANQDLALIKVDPSGLELKPLTLASSSSVQVGDTVYAIGTPYGLEETFTKGIVSALGPRNRRARRLEDHRRDPDRRGAQPGQLRRPAARRTGRGDRRQLPDRQRRGPDRRLPAREHRRRLRDLLEHGRDGREEDRGRGRGELRVGHAERRGQSEGGSDPVGEEQSPYGGRSPYGSESPYGEVEAEAGTGSGGGVTEGEVEAGGSGSSGVEGSLRRRSGRLERHGIPRCRRSGTGRDRAVTADAL